MNRLLVAGVYLVGFWTIYPIAETIAWLWGRWDQLRDRGAVIHTTNWYTG